MTTRILVVGKIDYPSGLHSMTLPLVLMKANPNIELISYESELVDVYTKLKQKTDDAVQARDELTEKYEQAVEQADVLLLLNPKDSEMVDGENDLVEQFKVWMGFLAGIANQQGVPTVLYAGKEDVKLHFILHKKVHAVLHNTDELQSYNFVDLAPINKTKILLPV